MVYIISHIDSIFYNLYYEMLIVPIIIINETEIVKKYTQDKL